MEPLKAREGFRRKRDTPAYFAAMYEIPVYEQ